MSGGSRFELRARRIVMAGFRGDGNCSFYVREVSPELSSGKCPGRLQSHINTQSVSPELVEGRASQNPLMVRQAHHQRIPKDFAIVLGKCQWGLTVLSESALQPGSGQGFTELEDLQVRGFTGESYAVGEDALTPASSAGQALTLSQRKMGWPSTA